MRTTLDIDDDILEAAKEIARAEKKTAGKVISDLARKALTGPAANLSGFAEDQQHVFDDDDLFPRFPKRGGPPITAEHVKRVQEDIDREDATPWDFETDKPRILPETRTATRRKRRR